VDIELTNTVRKSMIASRRVGTGHRQVLAPPSGLSNFYLAKPGG